MSIQSNKRIAFTVCAAALGMFCLAYASFPLYSLFCKVTGYGGTPKIAEGSAPVMPIGKKIITIHFNADISPELEWKFVPMQNEVAVHTGENKLAFFEATNLTNQPLTGMATYNVTPEKAAQYFTKIQCFCFNQQTLSPNATVQMPVSFFVDPAIENDPNVRDVNAITLSYTFFLAK